MSGAILTGSQVYGTPRPTSDVDLVVLVTQAELEVLREHGKSGGSASDLEGQASLRFGNLNLVVVTDPLAFDVWVEGTKALKKKKPVTRAEAVRQFSDLRWRAGIAPAAVAGKKPWEK